MFWGLSYFEIAWISVGILSWIIYLIDTIFWIYERREIGLGAYSREQIDALIRYKQVKYNHYHNTLWMVLCFWPMIMVIVKSFMK